MAGHLAQVVAYQVDNRGMFGGLLLVGHQSSLSVRHIAADGTFHGETSDLAMIHLDKNLGRETDKRIMEQQPITSFAAKEDLLEGQAGGQGDSTSEIGQVAVSRQHVPLDDVKPSVIVLWCGWMRIPNKICGINRGFVHISSTGEYEGQLPRIEFVDKRDKKSVAREVGEKEKRPCPTPPLV